MSDISPGDGSTPAAPKPPWRAVMVDIVVSGIIPTIVYHWLTTDRGWTEAQALAGVLVFPMIMSVVDVVRDGAVNIISGLSLVGIVMGLGAAWVGGEPRMLLIRESLFTVVLGIGALLTLLLDRPLLYWLSRAAVQRLGTNEVEAFEARYQSNPRLRRILKVLTAALGALFVLEFALRVLMVWLLPVETVLVAGPVVFNVVSLGGAAAMLLYARKAVGAPE